MKACEDLLGIGENKSLYCNAMADAFFGVVRRLYATRATAYDGTIDNGEMGALKGLAECMDDEGVVVTEARAKRALGLGLGGGGGGGGGGGSRPSTASAEVEAGGGRGSRSASKDGGEEEEGGPCAVLLSDEDLEAFLETVLPGKVAAEKGVPLRDGGGKLLVGRQVEGYPVDGFVGALVGRMLEAVQGHQERIREAFQRVDDEGNGLEVEEFEELLAACSSAAMDPEVRHERTKGRGLVRVSVLTGWY